MFPLTTTLIGGEEKRGWGTLVLYKVPAYLGASNAIRMGQK